MTEKAREGSLAKLHQQALEENPRRTPEEVEERVKELRSEQSRRAAGARRRRTPGAG